MTKLVNLVAILLLLVGCGSSHATGTTGSGGSGSDAAGTGGAIGTGGSGPDANQVDGSGGNGLDAGGMVVCSWPPAFTPGNQTGTPIATGCHVHALSDAVTGGTVFCSPVEYTLDCIGDFNALIPAPNAALGCRSLPLPTASNQSYYCCSCGEGLDGDPFASEPFDGSVAAGDAPGQGDATGREDGAACYPLFHACASDADCCTPNRCLNITGTLQCQQEGPRAGGSDAATDAASVALDAGACVWPANLTATGDASALGCWARATFNVCEVPNGGSVSADGTITGPDGKVVTNACHDACSTSEYALTCTGDMATPGVMPSPDSSLGCRVIPGPTPSNVTSYCCSCGQGQ